MRSSKPKPVTVRKPRVLWANSYCLLDTSSGASISVKEMLLQLAVNGYEVAVLGATVFDSEKGLSKLPSNWSTLIEQKPLVTIADGLLDHQLLVTKSIKHVEMTEEESGQWFLLYEQALDRFKPDLVFFYGGSPLDYLISNEARYRGIPVAAYLVNGNYTHTRWQRDVDLIITDSQATADYYQRKDGLDVTPVGTFINADAFRAKTHSRTHLLFINPTLEKGAGIVIQVALLLAKQRPDIQLEVVESRGNWQALVKMISAHFGDPQEQLSNVLVTANTSDMRPIYGRARLLLAPSLWWESGARVAVEAMLNGIPVICTDHGGLPEMIGNAGLKLKLDKACHEAPFTTLPSLDGIENLVKSIIEFYNNESRYSEYVARAKSVSDTVHNMANNTQRLITAFAPLIEKGRGGLH